MYIYIYMHIFLGPGPGPGPGTRAGIRSSGSRAFSHLWFCSDLDGHAIPVHEELCSRCLPNKGMLISSQRNLALSFVRTDGQIRLGFQKYVSLRFMVGSPAEGPGGDTLGWEHLKRLYKAQTDYAKPRNIRQSTRNTIQSPDRRYKAPERL